MKIIASGGPLFISWKVLLRRCLALHGPVMQCREMHKTFVKLCRWMGYKPLSIAYWGGVIYTCGAVL